MECKTFEKKFGNSLALRAEAKCMLYRYARRVIRCTEKSDGAKTELLFSLPGIFAMELCFGGKSVRLIKEGDVFRVPERAEKIRCLLKIIILDKAALELLIAGKVSLNRCAAERRLAFSGGTPFFSAFSRIVCEGDRSLLSDKRYKGSYLSEK